MIEFSMIMEILFYVEQTESFFLILVLPNLEERLALIFVRLAPTISESKFSCKIGTIVFISVLLQQVSGMQQATNKTLISGSKYSCL